MVWLMFNPPDKQNKKRLEEFERESKRIIEDYRRGFLEREKQYPYIPSNTRPVSARDLLKPATKAEEKKKENDGIANFDGKSFKQMTPNEFEDVVCKLFNAFGYNLSVTQRSKDGGIDLDGLRGGLGRARVVVQCKRYSSPVGVSAVRELFGVVSDNPEIAEGFLVTTSTFTQDAQAFARWKRITLIDGDELEMRFSKITGSEKDPDVDTRQVQTE